MKFDLSSDFGTVVETSVVQQVDDEGSANQGPG
jgi:hypothetical protein